MKQNLLALQSPLFAYRSHHNFLTVFFIVITLFLTACTEEGSSNKPALSATSYAATSAVSRLVIMDAYVDDNHKLIITGQNFDSGTLPVPLVNLDGTELNIIEHTASQIVAEVADDLDIDAMYLLSVTTGNDVVNYDPHALFHVDEVPSSQINQLLIVSVEASSEPGPLTLNLQGYNFDQGNWPAEVSINGIPQTVDIANSHAELLLVIVPDSTAETITEMQDDIVLVVQTGAANEHYDAYPLYKGMFEKEVTVLACNRSDISKAPIAGHNCCTTSGQTLCWSTGPIREDIKNFLFHYDDIPRYFHLTEDYVMLIAQYFEDPPTVAFPVLRWVKG